MGQPMTREQHEFQASQFVAMHRKRGGSWEDDFARWSRSKDFMHRDELAIRTIVVDELHSTTAVFVDPLQFLRGA
jgi:hypothetical protein